MFVVVKLVSGAELIAKMTSTSETSIVLKNPLQVVYSSSSFGIPAVTVQKFCPFAKQEIYNFERIHVMCINEISDASVIYYKEAVESVSSDKETIKDSQASQMFSKLSKGSIVH